MTRNLLILLTSTAAYPALAQQPAYDAPSATSTVEVESEEEEIVIVGQKPRGSVVGDIPPENVLDTRDIRATGATSISELLDSVAAQTGSARGRGGGRPILLLNGQRISGFRELRDLPPEAIERMEILPEEVSLKYGYAADQRVVNIVLRRRFNSTQVEVGGRAATDGDYLSGRAEVGRLVIRNDTRTSFSARVEGNDALLESDRAIALQPVESQPDPVDPRPFRTLVGASQLARITATHNRSIFGNVSATLTGEAERRQGRGRFGVPTGTLTAIDGDAILRAFPDDPLTRETTSDSLGLGFALNSTRGKWRLSSTGNADWSQSLSFADRGPDLANAQAQIDAGLLVYPLGDLGRLDDLQRDRAHSTRRSFDVDATATGPLFKLPAGEANATFKLGGSTTSLDSQSRRRGITTDSPPIGRDIAEGSVSLDLPIAKRDSAIGRLSANLNAEVSRLSDFGTLTSLGAGMNWSPKSNINLIASWTREDGAPSLQQLGDPLLETDNVPFFDAKRGETVNVTTLTGGNPALDADKRNVFKLGGNWKPSEKLDLRLRGEYIHQSIDRPQIGFPAATPALEAAFPGRFVRDLDDTLISVDLRPVNALRSTRDTIRYGFDFTKPLPSKRPSPAQIAQLREQFARRNPGVLPPGGATRPAGATPPPGEAPPPGAGADRPGGGGGFGGGRGGGMFGGRNAGRLTLSATHTVTLTDRLEIGPGIEPLDYLDGEALGATGGRPAHVVEVEGGYYNNGLGARLSADWRSATRVDGGVAGDDLRFSGYTTVDLRLFANLGERIELVSKHPFFRGSSVQLEVNNIFNSRPRVRDAAGIAPFAYQADRLEPIGRTVGINFRKLFLPRGFAGRGGQGGRPPGN